MRHEDSKVVLLSEYRPPDFLVETIDLDIRLFGDRAEVASTLRLRRNPDGLRHAPLILDGEDLTLVSLDLDGGALPTGAYTVGDGQLTIATIPDSFDLTVVTRIDLAANTRLMGLYRSNGVTCTQCEAEGFRRITYFPDRPDVLAVYTVRLEADRTEAPVLLANGNPAGSGEAGDGRHWALWRDPFPKPSYLFAVVAGRLDSAPGTFTTMSGREVALNIYVEPGKAEDAEYALGALTRSMRWDEEAFGREYDLDVFNIVAVSDFNFGAMENKGLNIFNDKYVMASPETATDQDFLSIEAVIAHEYFHNWSGNRVTCRDWFQLCLKEGLTVFRDQEFSADLHSRPVKRIQDVRNLRTQQFTEDAGPLAHPVRPGSYAEINNFYTVTVYEKGAELVRMLKTLCGPDAFRAAMDRYFAECDGKAVTVEDFVAAFAGVTGRDFSRFMRWYDQAGTPVVTVETAYDPAARALRLDLSQSTPPTPGQPRKEPFVIPIALGLLGADGRALTASLEGQQPAADLLLTLETPAMTILLEQVEETPVLSVLRDFSAPVQIRFERNEGELLTLARHDGDDFNRWQAVQTLATAHLLSVARAPDATAPKPAFLALFGHLIGLAARRPAFAALLLTLPAEPELAREMGENVDPPALHRTRRAFMAVIGGAHRAALLAARDALAADGPYSPDAVSVGRRSFRNVALDLLTTADPDSGGALAFDQFQTATNMTDRIAALSVLAKYGCEQRETAFELFERRHGAQPLVMDKWFSLQASIPDEGTLERVEALMAHPAFHEGNPNRVRALLGAFANGNPIAFHRADGASYRFLARFALRADRTNPQLAARLLTAFRSWRMLEPARRAKASAALAEVGGANLSSDLRDIVDRMMTEGAAA